VQERLGAREDQTGRWLVAAGVLAVAVGLPMVLAGPGNDLDVANIFRSGRALALHGDYQPSRAPGAPVHEALVGLADRLGGPVLTDLISLAAAAGLVVALDRLLAGEGLGPGRRWAIAVLVANPWFLVAATGTVDYVLALLFVVLAALALRRGHPVLAGLAAAASMGCRIGSAVLVGSLLLAELTEHLGRPSPSRAYADGADSAPDSSAARAGSGRAARGAAIRRVATTAGVAVVATAVLFVPSYRHAGGLSFAENDFSASGPLVLLGRAAVKNLMLLGPLGWLVVAATIPAVVAALRSWRASWLVRFAVPALVLSQVLFVRFPWKMPHLLPALVALAVLLAVALADRPRLLVALVALQLLYGVVSLDVVEPNRANEATGGRVRISLGWGPVVTDWRCRRDHPDPHLGRQKVEVEAAWNCSQPFDR